MLNKNIEIIQNRLKAARGEIKVDCLLRGGQMIDVFSGLIVEQSVAIHDGIVVGFGDYDASRIIELDGDYLIPGLIEAHIHIESSCLTPQKFADAVIIHGTTTVIADPHEIANVMGIKGIELMLEWGRGTPLDFYFMLPSCVPATSMETSGAIITAEDMIPLLDDPNVIGIAEMMNYPGAIYGDPYVLAKLSIGGKGQRIDGHAPGLMGKKLSAYRIAGPRTDHECSTQEEALEKLSRGMTIMIREGSTAKNLNELLPLVNSSNERRFVLVSDDRSAKDLMKYGHLDHILRRVIQTGIDPLIAIRMVTLNPAETFGLTNKGAIAPGYDADLITVKDLDNFTVNRVWEKGEMLYGDGIYPKVTSISVNSKSKALSIPNLKADKFTVRAKSGKIRVINIVPNQIVTTMSVESIDITTGFAEADRTRNIFKLIVIEIYTGEGNAGQGFGKGFGIKNEAIASTVAHDSHNLIICGDNDLSMKTAGNHLINIVGGLVVVENDVVVAILPLPIAGIMSNLNALEVARIEKLLIEAAITIGI